MYKYILPTPEDIVGARSYLKLSQDAFAKKAGIAKKTLFNIENRKYEPSHEMLEKIQKTFLSEGIVFLQEGGFKANQGLIRVLEGDEGVREFFNDVLQTAKTIGGEFLVSGMDEVEFYSKLKRIGIKKSYRDVMDGMTKQVTYRVLVSENIRDKLVPPLAAPYCNYRAMPEDRLSSDVPFYIYADKLALILDDTAKVVIIKNSALVEAYKRMFETLWNSKYAKPVNSK